MTWEEFTDRVLPFRIMVFGEKYTIVCIGCGIVKDGEVIPYRIDPDLDGLKILDSDSTKAKPIKIIKWEDIHLTL